ncbi:conserved hypothetical protein [Burkholderia mallei NCTC 10247]|nr:conserved hypothetical protein [Burkholderia mallei NCTC 10247]
MSGRRERARALPIASAKKAAHVRAANPSALGGRRCRQTARQREALVTTAGLPMRGESRESAEGRAPAGACARARCFGWRAAFGAWRLACDAGAQSARAGVAMLRGGSPRPFAGAARARGRAVAPARRSSTRSRFSTRTAARSASIERRTFRTARATRRNTISRRATRAFAYGIPHTGGSASGSAGISGFRSARGQWRSRARSCCCTRARSAASRTMRRSIRARIGATRSAGMRPRT